MKLFSKKSSKNQPSSHEGDDSIPLPPDTPSPTRSPTKSSSRQQQQQQQQPQHGSSSSRKPSSSTSGGPQTSPTRKEHRPSRSSRAFVRHPTEPGHSSSSSRRSRIDLNTHPLNLPPEERKRLSALSNMSDPSAMDVDPPTGPSPSSPPPQPAQPQPQSAFSVPITNGTKQTNGDSAAPPVPPHRSNPSSPVPSPEEEAEAFKAAGNKYFKEKKYADAIKQYDKGKPGSDLPSCRTVAPLLRTVTDKLATSYHPHPRLAHVPEQPCGSLHVQQPV